MKEKTGLWKKQSKKGNNYYGGKIKIGDKEYSLALFKNNKNKDNQPDLTLYVEEIKKEKKSYTLDEMVYDVKDEDLAF